MKSLIRIFVLLILTLSLFVTISCKDPYQQKCQEICSFFISCVEQDFKAKRNITDSEKSLLRIDCESGCLREQGFAMPCYESEKTCKGFSRCIMESGLMD
ncbi:Cys-rich protein [Leptospira perolatii]|uniref:Cys-rich protein n=1 Tax=Leptospira perolatii TaxID=2023191 RepID=A0A2M9ZIC6_9LEPT|nr:Cys-rich protein [Leptospira perolatii]PJZ68215.1 Cys-rich protein [Leptospira perolatii]PJZ71762.1 Cys-rich protein [Leptospira perolatii]